MDSVVAFITSHIGIQATLYLQAALSQLPAWAGKHNFSRRLSCLIMQTQLWVLNIGVAMAMNVLNCPNNCESNAKTLIYNMYCPVPELHVCSIIGSYKHEYNMGQFSCMS